MYVWDVDKTQLLHAMSLSLCRAACTCGTWTTDSCYVPCLCLCVGLYVHVGRGQGTVATCCFSVYLEGCMYVWDVDKGQLLRAVSLCVGLYVRVGRGQGTIATCRVSVCL